MEVGAGGGGGALFACSAVSAPLISFVNKTTFLPFAVWFLYR